METFEKPQLKIVLFGAELKAPETLEYLNLAIQLIEIRKREIEQSFDPIKSVENTLSSFRIKPISVSTEVMQDTTINQINRTSRARWFLDQWPLITLEDGSFHNPKSTADLKELIKSRGLTPHPRGDASMLLWQVRNRLQLLVETVPVP